MAELFEEECIQSSVRYRIGIYFNINPTTHLHVLPGEKRSGIETGTLSTPPKLE